MNKNNKVFSSLTDLNYDVFDQVSLRNMLRYMSRFFLSQSFEATNVFHEGNFDIASLKDFDDFRNTNMFQDYGIGFLVFLMKEEGLSLNEDMHFQLKWNAKSMEGLDFYSGPDKYSKLYNVLTKLQGLISSPWIHPDNSTQIFRVKDLEFSNL
jgi:hypothetical protein